jgi:WD40 repeat protein
MDGKIISGSWDNTLKMWNVNAPKRKEDNIIEAEVINVQCKCIT